MSNRKRAHRRKQRRMPDDAIRAYGTLSAVARGCTCEPEYSIERGAFGDPMVTVVHIAHDDDCAAWRLVP